MRRISRTAAAIVLVSLLVATGCAERKSQAARPIGVPKTAPPAPVPLTPQVAEKQFRTYVTDEDVARAAGDERLALTWVSDGQSMLTAAEFRKAAFDGDPVRRFSYGKPKLYVPKLKTDIYPHWFVASVPRTVQGDPKSTRTALMVFMLRGPSDRWKLSLATLLEPKAKEPKVVLDPDGYATALPPDDSSVLIRPRDVGGIQATIAAEGGGSVAANVMRSGPTTTGYYQQMKRDKKKAKEKHLTLQVVYTATPFPFFALRTDRGGSLVFYSLFRNTVLSVQDKQRKPLIPKEAAHLLDGTVEGTDINMSATLEYAAYDPPRAKRGKPQQKAGLLADDGWIVKASTPPVKTP